MFLHPLGLFALLAVPAVVALHLFRRRFRPRVVSALYLWEPEDRTALAGRKRERLRTSASFWLELGAALVLGLAFAGPRACGAGEAEHLVVVLDDSASMGANAGGQRLSARARELVRERIGALPLRSRVTLVQSGGRPELLAGPAAFPLEAEAALAGWEPDATGHDLTPAVAFGLQLAGEGAVLLVTDRFEPDRFPPEVELAAVGEPLANAAITVASRSRAQTEDGRAVERLFVTVAGLAAGPLRTRLEIAALPATGTGPVLERLELELAPGERRHLSFELEEGAPAVEARLSPDALAIDDRAVLVPPPPRTLALASELAPEVGRRLGLTTGGEGSSPVERWLEIVPSSVDAGAAGAAHLLVAAGAPGPAAGSRTWALVLAATGDERADLIGPFLADRRHPLLEGTTLEGIVWSLEPGRALPGTPLVSAGNTPILTEERRDGRRSFHLNLDPARSSLQRSPDWPILLANLAELRRRELPGPERVNLHVGETLTYRGEGTGPFAPFEIEGEGERHEVPARETLVYDGLDRPGRYALSRGGAPLCELGVRFGDAGESDLGVLSSGRRESSRRLGEVRAGPGRTTSALLALALLLVLGDWLVLARGRGRAVAAAEGGAA